MRKKPPTILAGIETKHNYAYTHFNTLKMGKGYIQKDIFL